jgi:anti-sigma B factor antagonist
MSEFEVGAVQLNDTVHAVTIQGDVDIATSPQVKEVIGNIMAGGCHNLIIDLQGVRYIDTTGMVVLVHALKRIREKQGRIVIVCVNARICKFFALTGLQHVFTIYDSIESALKSFQPRAA